MKTLSQLVVTKTLDKLVNKARLGALRKGRVK